MIKPPRWEAKHLQVQNIIIYLFIYLDLHILVDRASSSAVFVLLFRADHLYDVSLTDGDALLAQRSVPQENGDTGGSSVQPDTTSRCVTLSPVTEFGTFKRRSLLFKLVFI